jgi:hypothetical protein
MNYELKGKAPSPPSPLLKERGAKGGVSEIIKIIGKN